MPETDEERIQRKAGRSYQEPLLTPPTVVLPVEVELKLTLLRDTAMVAGAASSMQANNPDSGFWEEQAAKRRADMNAAMSELQAAIFIALQAAR